MRAAMITRYQQPLEIVNLADPKLPKDGIIMRVRATGVCRSDWHTWMGHYADQRCCQTNENSHRIAGAALIYALNSWRHSVRAAVRLSLR